MKYFSYLLLALLLTTTLHAQNAKLRIIMIGAHPDDCDIDGGGTAILYAKMGHAVKFVSVTNGDAGHQQMQGAPLAKRRFAEAKEAFKQAINSSQGNFAPAQFRLGLLNAQDGDHSTAMRLFQEAIRRPGAHLSASHNNLGVVLAQLGRLQEAEHEFKTALRLSDGALEDAAENLKLCREALANEKIKTAALKSLILSRAPRSGSLLS